MSINKNLHGITRAQQCVAEQGYTINSESKYILISLDGERNFECICNMLHRLSLIYPTVDFICVHRLSKEIIYVFNDILSIRKNVYLMECFDMEIFAFLLKNSILLLTNSVRLKSEAIINLHKFLYLDPKTWIEDCDARAILLSMEIIEREITCQLNETLLVKE